ncbi:MAG TPA: TNT domain-containing protein, partial [Acetobacteraceae bacterium]|nr:TNT domain-containing protein [Acetobacteraceae bacterium]
MQRLASRSLWPIALLAASLAQAADAAAQCQPPPGTQWPPDNGCKQGTVSEMMLPGGMEIDRYGLPSGSYFAPTRTPIPARAMACDPVAMHLPHSCYVLERPATFEACETAAWFGQPGGGT